MPIFAANLHFLFNELPFLERFEAAARLGFRGVEYPYPYAEDPQPIAALLRECDLAMVLLNFPPGDREGGERGIACLPGREREFEQHVDLALTQARALGCTRLNCLAGRVPADVAPSVWYRRLADNLAFACDRLAPYGISVLLEPMNEHDVPGYCLTTSSQTRQLINDVGANNLRLQYDLYHMQIMEGDLARNIESNLDIIAHIQIADNPGRQEPGTGEISFSFIFDLLDRVEYEGWISCEYTPSATTADSVEWMRPYLFVRSLPIDD